MRLNDRYNRLSQLHATQGYLDYCCCVPLELELGHKRSRAMLLLHLEEHIAFADVNLWCEIFEPSSIFTFNYVY